MGQGSFLRNRAPQFVYEFWDADGRCLYVGITSSIGARLSDHASKRRWWPEVSRIVADKMKNRDHALTEEKHRIVKLQPRNNFVHAEISVGSRSGVGHGGVAFRRSDVMDD